MPIDFFAAIFALFHADAADFDAFFRSPPMLMAAEMPATPFVITL